MLNIESVNHIGIRIRDKDVSTAFYQSLGFVHVSDAGFEAGHPIIMRHPFGVVINLLGPADVQDRKNILMDVEKKHPGFTHVALTVTSLDDAKVFLKTHDIPLTGSFSFNGMSEIFIRDPDRNVIELDAYDGSDNDDTEGYTHHP